MFLAQFSLSTRGKRPVREGSASQFILVRTEFEHRTKQDTFRRMRANVIVADAREIAIRCAHDSTPLTVSPWPLSLLTRTVRFFAATFSIARTYLRTARWLSSQGKSITT